MKFVDRAKAGRSTATSTISGSSSKLWVVKTLTPSSLCAVVVVVVVERNVITDGIVSQTESDLLDVAAGLDGCVDCFEEALLMIRWNLILDARFAFFLRSWSCNSEVSVESEFSRSSLGLVSQETILMSSSLLSLLVERNAMNEGIESQSEIGLILFTIVGNRVLDAFLDSIVVSGFRSLLLKLSRGIVGEPL